MTNYVYSSCLGERLYKDLQTTTISSSLASNPQGLVSLVFKEGSHFPLLPPIMLLAAWSVYIKRHRHVSVFSFSLKKPFPDVWDDPCKRLVLLQENCINWAASQHLSILTYLHYYSLHFYYKCICWHKHRFIRWRTFMHSIYVHRHCIGGFHPRRFNESSKFKV